MNIYTKIGIMACGVAVVSSAATAFAISKLNNNGSSSLFMAPEATEMRAGGLYTVSNLASTPPTDFTHAAESTINGVVSIKSYATPKGYYGQQGEGTTTTSTPSSFSSAHHASRPHASSHPAPATVQVPSSSAAWAQV